MPKDRTKYDRTDVRCLGDIKKDESIVRIKDTANKEGVDILKDKSNYDRLLEMNLKRYGF